MNRQAYLEEITSTCKNVPDQERSLIFGVIKEYIIRASTHPENYQPALIHHVIDAQDHKLLTQLFDIINLTEQVKIAYFQRGRPELLHGLIFQYLQRIIDLRRKSATTSWFPSLREVVSQHYSDMYAFLEYGEDLHLYLGMFPDQAKKKTYTVTAYTMSYTQKLVWLLWGLAIMFGVWAGIRTSYFDGIWQTKQLIKKIDWSEEGGWEIEWDASSLVTIKDMLDDLATQEDGQHDQEKQEPAHTSASDIHGFSGEVVGWILNATEFQAIPQGARDREFFANHISYLPSIKAQLEKNTREYYQKHQQADGGYLFTVTTQKGNTQVYETEKDYQRTLAKVAWVEKAVLACEKMLYALRWAQATPQDLHVFFDDVFCTHLWGKIAWIYHKVDRRDKNIHVDLSVLESEEEFVVTLAHEFAHALTGTSSCKIRNEGMAELLATYFVYDAIWKDKFDIHHPYAVAVADYAMIASTYGWFDWYENFTVDLLYRYENATDLAPNALCAASLSLLLQEKGNTSIDPHAIIFFCGWVAVVKKNLDGFGLQTPQVKKYIQSFLRSYAGSPYARIENSWMTDEAKITNALQAFYANEPHTDNSLKADIVGYGNSINVDQQNESISSTWAGVSAWWKTDGKEWEEDPTDTETQKWDKDRNDETRWGEKKTEKKAEKKLEYNFKSTAQIASRIQGRMAESAALDIPESVAYYAWQLQEHRNNIQLFDSKHPAHLDSLVTNTIERDIEHAMYEAGEYLEPWYKERSWYADEYAVRNFLRHVWSGAWEKNEVMDCMREKMHAYIDKNKLRKSLEDRYVSYVNINGILPDASFIRDEAKKAMEQELGVAAEDMKNDIHTTLVEVADDVGLVNEYDRMFKVIENILAHKWKIFVGVRLLLFWWLAYVLLRKYKDGERLEKKLSWYAKSNKAVKRSWERQAGRWYYIQTALLFIGLSVLHLTSKGALRDYVKFGMQRTKQELAVDKEEMWKTFRLSQEDAANLIEGWGAAVYSSVIHPAIERHAAENYHLFYSMYVERNPDLKRDLELLFKKNKKPTLAQVQAIISRYELHISMGGDEYVSYMIIFLLALGISLYGLWFQQKYVIRKRKQKQRMIENIWSVKKESPLYPQILEDLCELWAQRVDAAAAEWLISSVKKDPQPVSLHYALRSKIMKFLMNDDVPVVYFTNVSLLKQALLEVLDTSLVPREPRYSICINFSKEWLLDPYLFCQVHKGWPEGKKRTKGELAKHEDYIKNRAYYLAEVMRYVVWCIERVVQESGAVPSSLLTGGYVDIQYFVEGSYIASEQAWDTKSNITKSVNQMLNLALRDSPFDEQTNIEPEYDEGPWKDLIVDKTVFIWFPPSFVEKNFPHVEGKLCVSMYAANSMYAADSAD